MPSATQAAHDWRQREGYFERFLRGRGIDIGCGDSPVTPICDCWDLERGDSDAQAMTGAPVESYDFVYSSCCLEHLGDAKAALVRWWELVKPSGYLLVTVPDEDLYEQGHWPSIFATDHRWTFTLYKAQSWSPASLNVIEFDLLLPGAEVVWVKRFDHGYDYEGGVWDRTAKGAEAYIEFLARKRA